MSRSVSIIIPSYNRRLLLHESLKAIDNQKFKGHLETIVVDDGSTDGTIQILSDRAAASGGSVFRYFETSHLGPANARNLGVAHAKGDILIFLDDDSVIQNEDYVQQMVESFKENNVGITAGKTVDFYSHILNLVRAGDPPEIDFDNPLKLSKTIGVPTKNAAFLKESIQKAGGFNPIFKYSYGEDIDLCIRILNHGYRLVFNKEALVYHYPTYTLSQYIKKSYFNGFSIGIFRSLYPDKNAKFCLLKKVMFPLLAVRQFIKKVKFCFSKSLFTKAVFKEIALMFAWIIGSYAALCWGEADYQIKKFLLSIKVKAKLVKDFNGYLFELLRYHIKGAIPIRRKSFILYLTNRCNQRCQHCFFSKSINKNVQELSLDDLGRIAANYRQYTNIRKPLYRNIYQGFTGGEPFLRNDLLSIISLFKKAGVRYFQVNTNGMLTGKIIDASKELLKQGIPFMIIVSIDGLEKTHDKIRNTPGAFQKTVQTIKELKGIGADVGAIMTISRLNYMEIGDTIEFLNNKFNIEPGLQLVRGVDQSHAPVELRNADSPLEKDILLTEDIIPKIRSVLCKVYSKKLIKNPLRMMEFVRKFTYLQSHLDILESKKRLFDCRAGKSVGVIYQNGDVALCEFYKSIGNLKTVNFDLPLLWKSPLAQEQRAFIKKCFCNHDCFINVEYNYRFAKHLICNLYKFSITIHENSSYQS